ncbi:MAG: hypothetical protein Q7J82_05890, partial [Coriobacteriia bacterium]|nr:hypothetical protein [Coriobacteriia bacterium]
TNLDTHTGLEGTNVHGLGTAAIEDATAFDSAGSAGAVQTNLDTHTGFEGTNVHGLGNMSLEDTGDYYTRTAADLLLDTKAGTGTVAGIDSRLSVVETGKVDHVDAGYQNLLTNTATKAQGDLADSALQPGADGTSTNLSDYNNDPGYITEYFDTNAVWGNISGTLANQLDLTSTVALAASSLQPGADGTSTNLSDYNNDVPFLTTESDPIWAGVSNTVVYTSDPALTDARTPLAHDQGWTTITSTPTTVAGYGITDAVLTNDPALTDARTPLEHNQAWSTITATPTTVAGYGITDAATGTPVYVESDPVWENEKAGYATGTPLYVETYLGTITGATITDGAATGVTTNGGVLAFTVVSNTPEQYLGTITGATVTESSSASSVTTNAGVLEFNIRTNAAGGGAGVTNQIM